ncbi:MAG: sigma-54-dependent Fis family transcriptional regulator [Bacteroidales bacterium]|nr:sigma-54-dependent Fis family transcriptional regulator [Bacteroidales bacterium]
MDIQLVKQRFGIIGNSPLLNRALDIAMQVASTDLAVLISGESGTGKENIPQIIHSYSSRKHGTLIAVNCGAIPDGTIDSELFGHEKGAFTGAIDKRRGYFEVADKGTIFLDEVADLPLSTQVRLLRVLETGEFMKVGSSQVQKTNVRVVAATNVNIQEAIRNNKFREDLYYRLNSIPIYLPPLRERKEDIPFLFKKFANDFSEKYRMPSIQLGARAMEGFVNYRWPGNIRQLKNITEQISIIEKDRTITIDTVKNYLKDANYTELPALINNKSVDAESFANEREILYKVLFDMKRDVTDLKKLVMDVLQTGGSKKDLSTEDEAVIQRLYDDGIKVQRNSPYREANSFDISDTENIQDTHEIIEESLSLEDKEKELIIKALDKHNGKRKYAAEELGISERTLYRKIKEYDIK